MIKLWRAFTWRIAWLIGGWSDRAVERRTGPRALVHRGWFWVVTKDGRGHTLPMGDTREHRLSTACWCKPDIDGMLASHNAQDSRT